MVDYHDVAQLAEQLPTAEKARLIEHLRVLLRHEIENDDDIQRLSWHDFIERTAGSLAATPIERPPQPPLETREPLE